MSDTAQGPGWWIASDGRWYPPDWHPSALAAPPPPAGMVPPRGYGQIAPERTRRKIVALALLIGGAASGVAGLAFFVVVGIVGIVGSTVYQAPTRVAINCQSGDYYVYQQTGSQDSVPGFSFTRSGPTTLEPEQVRVVGADRGVVPTWSGSGSETITKGSEVFSNAVGFHVRDPGRYSVTIASAPTAVMIAPSLGSQLIRAAPWLILTAVGFSVATVGLVLLIVSWSRRRRQPQGFVPGGWPLAREP